VTPQSAPELESTTYFFNGRELARLAVYRAAIRARFYNDQCEPIGASASLPRGESPHPLLRREDDRGDGQQGNPG
jgi:hypothetical protein